MSEGDIVSVPYLTDIPAGLYEVLSVNPLWLKNEGDGAYNGQYHDFGTVELVCKLDNREDKREPSL